jgi:hypothetical protein
MTDLATRAKLAKQNAEEIATARAVEQKAARRQRATETIHAKAVAIGVADDLDLETLSEQYGTRLFAHLSVCDDATLELVYEEKYNHTVKATLPQVTAHVVPCDQLYWDLPPGQLKKEPGGGTYGCYGLGRYSRIENIESLADLGAAIELVEQARAQWHKKHGSER